jgi:hypothetical protein
MKIKPYNFTHYNPEKDVVLANEIIENCRYSLSPEGFKIIMGLSQSIDYTNELFPEFEIEMKGLFKFLRLNENDGNRYDIVRNAFENIVDNPLKYRVDQKKWGGVPWLSYHYNEAYHSRIRISFHPDIIPFLLAFKETAKKGFLEGYTKMLPKFYERFESKYATHLYPLFKKWQDTGNWRPVEYKKTIEWLKEKTFTEKESSYKKNTGDWIRRVINPAIDEINLKSELFIKRISKENKNLLSEGMGKTYTHVIFIVSTKPEYISVHRTKIPKNERISKYEDPSAQYTIIYDEKVPTAEFATLEEVLKKYTTINEFTGAVKQSALNAGFQEFMRRNHYVKFIKVGNKRYFVK